MPEKESMRPLKKRALLTGICAIVICTLAAAVAGLATADPASPRRLSGTCCVAVRPTVHQRTGASWISSGAREPDVQRPRAEVTFRAESGSLRHISVPYLTPLSGGVTESLASHRSRTWWGEGFKFRHHPHLVRRTRTRHRRQRSCDATGCSRSAGGVPGHRRHLVRHRQLPSYRPVSPPHTLPQVTQQGPHTLGKNGARTRSAGLRGRA